MGLGMYKDLVSLTNTLSGSLVSRRGSTQDVPSQIH